MDLLWANFRYVVQYTLTQAPAPDLDYRHMAINYLFHRLQWTVDVIRRSWKSKSLQLHSWAQYSRLTLKRTAQNDSFDKKPSFRDASGGHSKAQRNVTRGVILGWIWELGHGYLVLQVSGKLLMAPWHGGRSAFFGVYYVAATFGNGWKTVCIAKRGPRQWKLWIHPRILRMTEKNGLSGLIEIVALTKRRKSFVWFQN